MPKRVTMLLRNRRVAPRLIFLCLLSLAVAAQNAPQAPPRSSQPAAPPPQSQAPPPAQTAPQGQGQGQEPGVEPGGFVFHSDVQEVVLHATVMDDKQHIITDLDRNAFTIFEDGKPQTIKSFHHEDIPISLGIVIDNSGSMREKRAKVVKAAINLVKANNANDDLRRQLQRRIFPRPVLHQQTHLLQTALEKYEIRGGTALYDAVVASADELKKHGKLQKKILFVVTDGEDDASRDSSSRLSTACRKRMVPPSTPSRVGKSGRDAPGRPSRLFPTAPEASPSFLAPWTKLTPISSTVARDIRNQYTIGYKPTTPKSVGGYRTIRVSAREFSNICKMTVRTRSGMLVNK